MTLARQARPTGLISYTMAVEDGLRRHAMYVYDLALPADFRRIRWMGKSTASN